MKSIRKQSIRAIFAVIVLIMIVALILRHVPQRKPHMASKVVYCGSNAKLVAKYTLERLETSSSFEVGANSQIWVRTSTGRDGAGVGPSVGPIAIVSAVKDGEKPHIIHGSADITTSQDPAAVLGKPNEEVLLPIAPGRWSVYTLSHTAGPLMLDILTCPAN